MGNPLTVAHVALAARNLLQLSRVDEQQLDVAFQNVPKRLPQHPGRLHGHVRHLVSCQPIQHPEQVAGHGSEGLDQLQDVTLRLQFADARDNGPFVDIQSRHMPKDDVHENLPVGVHRRRTS